MQKEKTKHDFKGATGATLPNIADIQALNVAPTHKKVRLLHGCYRSLQNTPKIIISLLPEI
jgi:hypothetical protein